MRAVHVDSGPRLVEIEPREPAPGEVRVRVDAAAITGLDLDVIEGRKHFTGVPGHSFVGRVVSGNGPIAQRLVGRRVLPSSGWGCGVCDDCAAQLENRCVHRRVAGLRGADGGHAEFVVMPARALHVLDADLTDEAAVLVPLVAAVLGGVLRAELPEWTNLLVVGDGGAGLLAAVALASAGYTVTVRGRHGDRFDLLRRYRINFNLVDDDSEKNGMRPGRYGPALMSYPYVVEATGHPSGWSAALELVSPGGCVLAMSSAQDGVPRSLERIHAKSARVLGLREGPVDAVARMMGGELLDPTRTITRVHDFEDVLRAYERAAEPREWMNVLRMAR